MPEAQQSAGSAAARRTSAPGAIARNIAAKQITAAFFRVMPWNRYASPSRDKRHDRRFSFPEAKKFRLLLDFAAMASIYKQLWHIPI